MGMKNLPPLPIFKKKVGARTLNKCTNAARWTVYYYIISAPEWDGVVKSYFRYRPYSNAEPGNAINTEDIATGLTILRLPHSLKMQHLKKTVGCLRHCSLEASISVGTGHHLKKTVGLESFF